VKYELRRKVLDEDIDYFANYNIDILPIGGLHILIFGAS
jgi:hypothetical protein